MGDILKYLPIFVYMINHDDLILKILSNKCGPKCQAITIWTIKDPEKRECAKHNHLNFKEVWDLYEGKEFIDYIYNEFKNINV